VASSSAKDFAWNFWRGASGSVDELVLHQPSGTFIAHRIAAAPE
jgi:hypothetical protein